MRLGYQLFLLSVLNSISLQTAGQDYLQSGISFFDAVKSNEFEEADKLIKTMANGKEEILKSQLNTENKAKAFWINFYNTYVQYLLKKDPGLFKDRSKFFKTEYITLANQKLSLDDIEHGIIRRSRNKYTMGYLGSFFVSNFEKNFRLETIDYRIHFALNCGAKSCPPVALYKPNDLEAQLDKSAGLYLKTFARYKPKENIAMAPVLCSWFNADFGGGKGVLAMMKKYKIVPPEKDPDIDYLSYDWTLKLSNYITL